MPSVIRVVSVAAAATLLVGGGFLAGRMTGPAGEPANSACKEAQQVVAQALDDVQQAPEYDEAGKQQNVRLAANAILQNPQCFSAADRATAQSAVDGLDQQELDRWKEDFQQCVDDATDDYSWSNC
ncbi:hypothetical protein [Streptomyces sp. SYSU K21746]